MSLCDPVLIWRPSLAVVSAPASVLAIEWVDMMYAHIYCLSCSVPVPEWYLGVLVGASIYVAPHARVAVVPISVLAASKVVHLAFSASAEQGVDLVEGIFLGYSSAEDRAPV